MAGLFPKIVVLKGNPGPVGPRVPSGVWKSCVPSVVTPLGAGRTIDLGFVFAIAIAATPAAARGALATRLVQDQLGCGACRINAQHGGLGPVLDPGDAVRPGRWRLRNLAK